MDGTSFDSWTKARATAANRRTMLGWSFTAGIAAALGRVLPTSAQFGGGEGSCTYTVTLTSSLTPGVAATGALEIAIGDDGAIDEGTLTLAGQSAAQVVGQANGVAIDLLAALSDGTTLSLIGVAGAAISDCASPILGVLANPDTGQVGTWKAESGQGSGSGSGSGATAPPPAGQTGSGSGGSGAGGGSGTGGGSGGGSGSGGSGGSGSACLELHSQCNASAECCSGWCTDNECRSCGDTICGEDCIVLSDNLAHCGACFNACDVDTQSCINGTCTGGDDGGGGGGQCVDLGGGCGFSAQCCSGWCNNGTCDSCGMVVCNDMCVDTTSDNNNCGNCNNMCIGTSCQNGSCQ